MTHPTRIECVDCSRLPSLPANEAEVDENVEYRPRTVRPIHRASGPRKPRCSTHHWAARKAEKSRRADARRARVYRLDRETFAALWELQGRACPCGRQPRREPDTDHDHALARQHDHPTENACPLCLRGLLCRSCNTWVVDRYNPSQLRALADYIEDPPAQRLLLEAS